ncbi:MAG: hypothetical protein H5U01_01745 [Clostridia bacterium]|nr:hypothetical protein [Clostridia bacterium]MBC7347121.1 hypothetical protein [Clostridia bacterium]
MRSQTKDTCPYWREYDSPNGPIGFCEVAAYNYDLSWEALEAIGCPLRQVECSRKMVAMVGAAGVPRVRRPEKQRLLRLA